MATGSAGKSPDRIDFDELDDYVTQDSVGEDSACEDHPVRESEQTTLEETPADSKLQSGHSSSKVDVTVENMEAAQTLDETEPEDGHKMLEDFDWSEYEIVDAAEDESVLANQSAAAAPEPKQPMNNQKNNAEQRESMSNFFKEIDEWVASDEFQDISTGGSVGKKESALKDQSNESRSANPKDEAKAKTRLPAAKKSSDSAAPDGAKSSVATKKKQTVSPKASQSAKKEKLPSSSASKLTKRSVGKPGGTTSSRSSRTTASTKAGKTTTSSSTRSAANSERHHHNGHPAPQHHHHHLEGKQDSHGTSGSRHHSSSHRSDTRHKSSRNASDGKKRETETESKKAAGSSSSRSHSDHHKSSNSSRSKHTAAAKSTRPEPLDGSGTVSTKQGSGTEHTKASPKKHPTTAREPKLDQDFEKVSVSVTTTKASTVQSKPVATPKSTSVVEVKVEPKSVRQENTSEATTENTAVVKREPAVVKREPAVVKREPVPQVAAFVESLIKVEYSVRKYTSFYCNPCQEFLLQTLPWEDHVTSGVHKRNAAIWRDCLRLEQQPFLSEPASAQRNVDNDKKHPVITGADYVVEIVNPELGKPEQWVCLLCCAVCDSVDRLLLHLSSFGHLDNHMEKVNPYIFTPPISVDGEGVDKQKQMAMVRNTAAKYMGKEGKGQMRGFAGDRFVSQDMENPDEADVEETLVMSLMQELFNDPGNYKVQYRRIPVANSAINQFLLQDKTNQTHKIVGLQYIVEIWPPSRRAMPVYYCMLCNYLCTNCFAHCNILKHSSSYLSRHYKSVHDAILTEAKEETRCRQGLVLARQKVAELEGYLGRIQNVLQIQIKHNDVFVAINAVIVQRIIGELNITVTQPPRRSLESKTPRLIPPELLPPVPSVVPSDSGMKKAPSPVVFKKAISRDKAGISNKVRQYRRKDDERKSDSESKKVESTSGSASKQQQRRPHYHDSSGSAFKKPMAHTKPATRNIKMVGSTLKSSTVRPRMNVSTTKLPKMDDSQSKARLATSFHHGADGKRHGQSSSSLQRKTELSTSLNRKRPAVPARRYAGTKSVKTTSGQQPLPREPHRRSDPRRPGPQLNKSSDRKSRSRDRRYSPRRTATQSKYSVNAREIRHLPTQTKSRTAAAAVLQKYRGHDRNRATLRVPEDRRDPVRPIASRRPVVYESRTKGRPSSDYRSRGKLVRPFGISAANQARMDSSLGGSSVLSMPYPRLSGDPSQTVLPFQERPLSAKDLERLEHALHAVGVGLGRALNTGDLAMLRDRLGNQVVDSLLDQVCHTPMASPNMAPMLSPLPGSIYAQSLQSSVGRSIPFGGIPMGVGATARGSGGAFKLSGEAGVAGVLPVKAQGVSGVYSSSGSASVFKSPLPNFVSLPSSGSSKQHRRDSHDKPASRNRSSPSRTLRQHSDTSSHQPMSRAHKRGSPQSSSTSYSGRRRIEQVGHNRRDDSTGRHARTSSGGRSGEPSRKRSRTGSPEPSKIAHVSVSEQPPSDSAFVYHASLTGSGMPASMPKMAETVMPVFPGQQGMVRVHDVWRHPNAPMVLDGRSAVLLDGRSAVMLNKSLPTSQSFLQPSSHKQTQSVVIGRSSVQESPKQGYWFQPLPPQKMAYASSGRQGPPHSSTIQAGAKWAPSSVEQGKYHLVSYSSPSGQRNENPVPSPHVSKNDPRMHRKESEFQRSIPSSSGIRSRGGTASRVYRGGGGDRRWHSSMKSGSSRKA